jgi:hypothetical protein
VQLADSLSLLHAFVASEIEPFQASVSTEHLDVGRVATRSRYDMVSDKPAELGAEGNIARNAQFSLPHERYQSLHKSERAIARLSDSYSGL